MQLTRKKLRKLIMEMAVRQDILDAAASQPEERTTLINSAFDLNQLQNIRQPGLGEGFKPRGVWYGFGTNWIEFARNPNNLGLADRYSKPEYFYQLTVQTTDINNPDRNKILKLETSDDYQIFKQRYQFERVAGVSLGNWISVAKDYGGMEISDDLVSYLGWDIQSGCVWNKNAIINIKTLQDPSTHQNIPRGAAAFGVNLGWNPNAQTPDDIKNSKILSTLEDHEDDHYYPDARYEAEATAEGDNIWEKLSSFFDFDNIRDAQWLEEALYGNVIDLSYSNTYEHLGAVLWLIQNYNHSANNVDGTIEIIYSLDRDTDYDDALTNINKYLHSVSDQFNLGIKNIDLDYNDAWDNATADLTDYDDDY